MPKLDFQTDHGPRRIDLRALTIAGWTGRDAAAVQHHIDELAALGVPPPSDVPVYYRAGAELLTQTDEIAVLGADTSGEAEPMVVADDSGTLWLGLASDHTDRALEAVSVAKSKQICPKPVARDLWRFDDIADHLDELRLHAEIVEEAGAEPVPYQAGPLTRIRCLQDLIAGLPEGRLAPGHALFCGTLPVIGAIRPARRFRMRLHDPVRDRTITSEYDITCLPVVT